MEVPGMTPLNLILDERTQIEDSSPQNYFIEAVNEEEKEVKRREGETEAETEAEEGNSRKFLLSLTLEVR